MRRASTFLLLMILITLVLAVFPIGAQDVTDEIVHELETTQVTLFNPLSGTGVTVNLMRVLYVMGGLALLLAGWRFFRVALGIAGFAFGSNLGVAIGLSSGGGTLIVVLTSLAFGIFVALLAIFAYYAAIAIITGYTGLLLTVQILTWAGRIPSEDGSIMLFLILGAVVGALIGIALSFELSVILTSFLGAFMLIASAGLSTQSANLGGLLLLFIFGIVVQLSLARRYDPDGLYRQRRRT